MRGREHIAASDHLPQRLKAFRLFVNNLIKQSTSEPGRGDSMVMNCLREFGERWQARREHGKPRAVEKRTPDLESGSIELKRRQLQEHLRTPEIEIVSGSDQA